MERLIYTIHAVLAEGNWTWTLSACRSQHGETLFIIRRDGDVYDAIAHDRSDSRGFRLAMGNLKRYAVSVRS